MTPSEILDQTVAIPSDDGQVAMGEFGESIRTELEGLIPLMETAG